MSEGAVEDIRAGTTTWPPIRIRLPGPVTGRLMRTPCTAVDARATDGLASSCRRGTSFPDIRATAPGFSATAPARRRAPTRRNDSTDDLAHHPSPPSRPAKCSPDRCPEVTVVTGFTDRWGGHTVRSNSRPTLEEAARSRSAWSSVCAKAVEPSAHRPAGGRDLALLITGCRPGERDTVQGRPAVLDRGPRRRVASDNLALLEDASRARDVIDLLGHVLDLAGVGTIEQLEVHKRLPGVPAGDDREDLHPARCEDRGADRHRRVHALVGALPHADEPQWVNVVGIGHRRGDHLESQFVANLGKRWRGGVDVADRGAARHRPRLHAPLDAGRRLERLWPRPRIASRRGCCATRDPRRR